jgi:hemolysin activation/secretion protein
MCVVSANNLLRAGRGTWLTQVVGNPAVLCISLGALLSGGISHAQAPPDAGSLKRQIEQDQRKPLPEKAPSPFALPQPMKSIGGATVTVSAFRFSGNAQLSDKRLTAAVSAFINQPLDFAGLQNAALAVAAAYRNAGWVVRVYLPEQALAKCVSKARPVIFPPNTLSA